MKFIYAVLIMLAFSCNSNSNSGNSHSLSDNAIKMAIKQVLKAQETAWNNHDLESYMQGYWKSDSLKFYGRNGLTSGWNNTLANYKKGYPSKAESGTLKFTINDISKIENSTYLVFGEYHLERSIGNAHGVFTIIFKYIDGHWKIIADMSC